MCLTDEQIPRAKGKHTGFIPPWHTIHGHRITHPPCWKYRLLNLPVSFLSSPSPTATPTNHITSNHTHNNNNQPHQPPNIPTTTTTTKFYQQQPINPTTCLLAENDVVALKGGEDVDVAAEVSKTVLRHETSATAALPRRLQCATAINPGKAMIVSNAIQIVCGVRVRTNPPPFSPVVPNIPFP